MSRRDQPAIRAGSAPEPLPDSDGFLPAEITIVIPTLNERDNVPVLIERIAAALDGIVWEAIVVDDNSRDGTIEVVRALARRTPRVRGLRRIHRRGLAGASLEGMLASAAPLCRPDRRRSPA
jgi:dolichol-phosphate mannosyltransferase